MLEKFHTLEESNEALGALCDVIKTGKCAEVRMALLADWERFAQFLVTVPSEQVHSLVLKRMAEVETASENMQASGLHAGIPWYRGVLFGVFFATEMHRFQATQKE